MATLEQIQAQTAQLQAAGIIPPGSAGQAPAPPPMQLPPANPGDIGPELPPGWKTPGATAPAPPPQKPWDPSMGYGLEGRQALGEPLSASGQGPPAPAAPQAPDASAGAAPAQGEVVGYQAPQPQYVGAHFDPKNIPYTKQSMGEELHSFDHIAGAEQQLARAEQAKSTVIADNLEAEAARARQAMEVRQGNDAKRQEFIRGQMQKLDAATNEVSSGQIKAPTIFGNGAMADISAFIGIALGGGLQAKGGANPALEMINQRIARSLEEQKANADLKQRGLGNRQNLLTQYRDMFGDEKQAEVAYENAARESAIQQLQAKAQRAENPIIQANAQKAIAALQQQQIQAKMQFERMAFVPAHMTGGAARTVKADGNLVRLPDGRTVRFPTEKEAQEARAKLTAAYNTVDIYDKAARTRKDLSIAHPYDSYKKLNELDSDAERILPEWSLSHGQGQVKEEEARRYKKNLFPFTSLTDPAADEIIKQGREKEISQIDNLIRASGGEVVNEGYAYDKDGRLQKDDELAGEGIRGRRIALPPGAKKVGR